MSNYDFFSSLNEEHQTQDDAPAEEKTNVVLRIEGNEGTLMGSDTSTLTIVGDTELLLEIVQGVIIGLDGDITKVTKEY